MTKLKIPIRQKMPPVDRGGLAVFTHLIRAPRDPDETIVRGMKNGHDPLGWKTLRVAKSVEDWKELMLEHMKDRRKRTFNKLMVELTGRTADFWFETDADTALWHLVEGGLLFHTMKAPIYFWLSWKGRQAHR